MGASLFGLCRRDRPGHWGHGRRDDISRRLALVLWNAEIGGAETVVWALAQRFRRLGMEAELVIVSGEGPLLSRLRSTGTGYRTLGHRRGRDLLRHPRRFARAVEQSGPDGALLIECGFLGACLRVGGYSNPIVAVEHGSILFPSDSRLRRVLDRLNRASGAWADDAEVAVSDLVLSRMRDHPHSRRLRRIYNGIDPSHFAPQPRPAEPDQTGAIAVGFVGRLIPGKGADVLIRAVDQVSKEVRVTLLIAGDGPERSQLEALARSLGVPDVHFLGLIGDVQQFWQRCDIAIVPSDTFIESFCLAAVEAAACGKPVIATRNGALPEVVRDGATGTLVAPGDALALAHAIVSYARRPALREQHAAAARAWTIERFDLDDCARDYLKLFAEVDR